MSLIGNNSAIVSLGSSCQAAFQLRLQAPLLSTALNEEFVEYHLPFDWTLATPAQVADWLQSGVVFPQSPDELQPIAEREGAFLWPERGIQFGHDFMTPDGHDIAATFEATRRIYERRVRKLLTLRDAKNVIAVVANTQNNLAQVLPDLTGMRYRRDNIVRLKQVFESFLGRPCRMLCVTYFGMVAGDFTGDSAMDITVRRIPRDASPWQGNLNQWRRVLSEYFTQP
jgi:hypothetical protein